MDRHLSLPFSPGMDLPNLTDLCLWLEPLLALRSRVSSADSKYRFREGYLLVTQVFKLSRHGIEGIMDQRFQRIGCTAGTVTLHDYEFVPGGDGQVDADPVRIGGVIFLVLSFDGDPASRDVIAEMFQFLNLLINKRLYPVVWLNVTKTQFKWF
jgi:hypothetical protein